MRPEESKFLKFLGHKITDFNFRVQDDVPENQTFELELETGIDYKMYNKKHNIYELLFKIDVNGGRGFITCYCEARAGFALPAGATKAEIKTLMTVNAPAILFPYIRATVSTITALSGFGPIDLPAINFTLQKQQKGKQKKNKTKDQRKQI